MTVPTTTRKSPTYETNGVTTNFAYPFGIASESELKVYKVEVATGAETILSLGLDYTVTGVANLSGGEVVISPALASGYEITAVGEMPYTQEVKLSNQGPYHPDTVEQMVDKVTKLAIDLKEQIESSIRVGASDNSSTLLPQPNGVASVLKRATNGDFSLVPIDQTIIDALGDAPIDGKQYSRQDGDWYETELGIGSVSVKDFGAVGNGATDDSAAIQAAIDAVLVSGETLVFPPGTYMISEELQAFVDYTWTPGRTLKMVGEGVVTIRTTSTIVNMLELWGALDAPLIRGINFLNESAYRTTSDKMAIEFIGGEVGNELGIRGAVIEDCSFDGFSRAVWVAGVKDFTLQRCKFLNTKGRDGGIGTNATNPNVGIWFRSTTAGWCENVVVRNNYYNGYSGDAGIATDAPNTQACGDGFLYGTFDSGIISENIIENFGYEAIFVNEWVQTPAPSTTTVARTGTPVVIQGNVVTGSIPSGALQYNTGLPQTVGYGIRADIDNVIIQGNVVTEIADGILCYVDHSGFGSSYNVQVLNNYVSHRQGDAGLGEGISVVTANPNITYGVRIVGNTIMHDFNGATFPTTTAQYGVNLARCISPYIVDNLIMISNWTDDLAATETDRRPMTAFRVYSSPTPTVQGNRVFGAQCLLSRQGVPAYPTHVAMKGNTWVISQAEDDGSVARNDSSFTIVGDDTAYPIHATSTGAVTQNGDCGSVLFAAAADTIVVTNTLVTVDSVIIATVATEDATALTAVAIPGAGSFTIKIAAAATAETKVNWKLFT